MAPHVAVVVSFRMAKRRSLPQTHVSVSLSLSACVGVCVRVCVVRVLPPGLTASSHRRVQPPTA